MPILSVLAIDPKRYATYKAERFALLPKDTPPPVVALLTELLAYEHEQRPLVGTVVRQCEDLLEQIPGTSVSRWAKTRRWDDPLVVRGDLTDRTLVEEVFTTDTRARPPAPERAPTPVTPVLRDHQSDSFVRPKPTDVTLSGRRVGLAAFGVASVMASVALVALVVVGVVATISWSAAQEAPGMTDPKVEPDVPVLVDSPKVPDGPAVELPKEPIPEPPLKEPDPPKRDPVVKAEVVPPVVPESGVETPESIKAPPVDYRPDREPGVVRLTADGNVVAYISGSQGRFDLPADVPPGEYELLASFDGKAPIRVRTLNVLPNTRYNVKCVATMQRCSLK